MPIFQLISTGNRPVGLEIHSDDRSETIECMVNDFSVEMRSYGSFQECIIALEVRTEDIRSSELVSELWINGKRRVGVSLNDNILIPITNGMKRSAISDSRSMYDYWQPELEIEVDRIGNVFEGFPIVPTALIVKFVIYPCKKDPVPNPCRNCVYYHGADSIVCAVHPFGIEDDCSDKEVKQ